VITREPLRRAGVRPSESDIGREGAGWMMQRMVSRALAALGSLMALDLIAIMLLTVVDVVGRYVLNSPVLGASELVEFMLAILVFGTLPLATMAREHIVIDLVDLALTRRAKQLQQLLIQLASAALLAFVGWRLWVRAAELAGHGDVTQSLQLPLAPLAYLMSVMAWVSAALLLALNLRPPQEPQRPAHLGPG
jgi:TRAP-type C4-dicarboxylate transport system permease small subunit